MGSLHNIDFGVFWASWGSSGKEPGSGNQFPGTGSGSGNRFRVTGFAVPGNQFWELGPGFDWFRQVQKVACPRFRTFRCSMGSDRLGSVPEVWTEPVLGTRY